LIGFGIANPTTTNNGQEVGMPTPFRTLMVLLLAIPLLAEPLAFPTPSMAALYQISFTGKITESTNLELMDKIITGSWTYDDTFPDGSDSGNWGAEGHTTGIVNYSYNGSTIGYGEFFENGRIETMYVGAITSANDYFTLRGNNDDYMNYVASHWLFNGNEFLSGGGTLTPTSAVLNSALNKGFDFYNSVYEYREDASGVSHVLVYQNNFSGEILSVNSAEDVKPVPEPGTLMLLGSGLAGLIGFGRKKLQ
jgi:hypothetical protein